jgi:hypothetical protein
LWVDHFHFFELKQVMRQKDDQTFAELLNRLREGLHTDDDIQVLRSRQVDTNQITALQVLPHLFCRRQATKAHKTSVLQNVHSAEQIVIKEIHDISGHVSPDLQQTILSKISGDYSLFMGLQKELSLGIGLPGEICVNVDTADGLTNGASCLIKKFDFRVLRSMRCSIVWVEFEDMCIGTQWRVR